ncbi:Pectate lyase superfamily protein [Caballeronia humi]|uniref:Pectate lyase superfamily protein n=1 Tax=Caballeronia humi TaxID=326474 RepID=A0A158J1Q8_9BURK|nr:Pectate lyase superfamily protein [Caballeronia humi]
MVRRKFLASILAGSGALVLAACGGGSDPSELDAVANRSRRRGGSSSSGASSTPAAGTPVATTPANTSGVLLDTSFGVKGDGVTNDLDALQRAIDGSVGQILLITGKSRIDTSGLNLRTNSHIRFASGASIKLLPHNTQNYEIMRIWDVDNVTLESPYLDGSKELNSSKTGEWGMGISIYGSTNCTITSPTTINCWGDGIYINNSEQRSNVYSKNITINSHHASGCRRQGVSIISGSGITFNTPLWENIGGTQPGAGLDIEPNDNTAVIENIRIVNPTTKNCAGGGIQIWLAAFPGPVSKTVSVSISGHTDTGSPGGAFNVEALQLEGRVVKGSITSTNPVWKRAMILADWDKAGPTVTVTGAKIG